MGWYFPPPRRAGVASIWAIALASLAIPTAGAASSLPDPAVELEAATVFAPGRPNASERSPFQIYRGELVGDLRDRQSEQTSPPPSAPFPLFSPWRQTVDAVPASAPWPDPARLGLPTRQLPTLVTAIPLNLSQVNPPETADPLDLPPDVYEHSPVLQRWLESPPDVRADIRHDPSFRPRLQVAYTQLTTGEADPGLRVGIEDWWLGESRLAFSANYAASFSGDRTTAGANLRYYLRPLGSYFNLAPTVGYRLVDVADQATDDVAVGVHVILALSRTGAADVTFTQEWINLGSDREVSLTTVSAGYALTSQLRLGATIQRQNAPFSRDRTVGVGLEWLL